jgi:membrane-associated phospholipid phosphatase
MDITSNITTTWVDYIGFMGPFILILFSIFLLINKPFFLYFYIGGTIINIIINFILKVLFKDPRPNENKELFELVLNNGKTLDINKYGMPSGHVQCVAFSCIYIYLVLDNIYVLWFYLFVSILTAFQRYKYNMHTLFQILIGFMVGLIIGYFFFRSAQNRIKGDVCSKKDDNCFL